MPRRRLRLGKLGPALWPPDAGRDGHRSGIGVRCVQVRRRRRWPGQGHLRAGCAGYTRGQLEDLNKLAQSLGARGLLTYRVLTGEGSLDSLSIENVQKLGGGPLSDCRPDPRDGAAAGRRMGDLLLIVAGKPAMVNTVLGELRLEMGRRLNLIDPNVLSFEFVVDFPLLERDAVGQLIPVRHPFTMPVEADIRGSIRHRTKSCRTATTSS